MIASGNVGLISVLVAVLLLVVMVIAYVISTNNKFRRMGEYI